MLGIKAYNVIGKRQSVHEVYFSVACCWVITRGHFIIPTENGAALLQYKKWEWRRRGAGVRWRSGGLHKKNF